jgi:hypothetical protein
LAKYHFTKSLEFIYTPNYVPPKLLATDDVSYDPEYLNAPETLAEWNEYRPTSTVSGWGATNIRHRMSLAMAGRDGNFHVTFRRTKCSCGVRLKSKYCRNDVDYLTNGVFDVALSYGHLDSKTGGIVKVFVVAESVQQSFGFLPQLMNPRWVCVDCGELGVATPSKGLRFEPIIHFCPLPKEHKVPEEFPDLTRGD